MQKFTTAQIHRDCLLKNRAVTYLINILQMGPVMQYCGFYLFFIHFFYTLKPAQRSPCFWGQGHTKSMTSHQEHPSNCPARINSAVYVNFNRWKRSCWTLWMTFIHAVIMCQLLLNPDHGRRRCRNKWLFQPFKNNKYVDSLKILHRYAFLLRTITDIWRLPPRSGLEAWLSSPHTQSQKICTGVKPGHQLRVAQKPIDVSDKTEKCNPENELVWAECSRCGPRIICCWNYRCLYW